MHQVDDAEAPARWTGRNRPGARRRKALEPQPGARPGIGTPSVWTMRKALSTSTMAAPAIAAALVSAELANTPIMSDREQKITSAIIGSGSAMLSTTWLTTSAWVESAPRPTTTNAGNMVT